MKEHWWQISLAIIILFVVAYICLVRLEAKTNPVALIDSDLYGHKSWSQKILNQWGVDHIAYENGVALELYRAVNEGRQVLIIPGFVDSFGAPGDCKPVQQNMVMLEALKYAAQRATVYIGNNDCSLFNPYVVRVGATDGAGRRIGENDADIWRNGCEFTCTFSEAILRAALDD